MNLSQATLAYYNKNAQDFIERTVYADVSLLQNEFIHNIKKGGLILDLGCGSGRDSKFFLNRGYKVVMVDGSIRMCKYASHHTGQNVICETFQEYTPDTQFDGIWACASLLHFPSVDIIALINKYAQYLVTDGCFFLSFKEGTFSGMREERYFTDLTKDTFMTLMSKIPNLTLQRQYTTSDSRKGRKSEKWLNLFLRKKG